MSNYIKIDRKILEWEWYKNLNTCRLFFHMLLKANWKDGRFEGKEIKRGSFVTSIKKLAEETELTEDEVKTAIKHLIDTGEVTKQTTNKYTVITVSNYDLYQEVTKQNQNNSQTIPKLFPTIEEKEGKKEKNKKALCKAEALALFESLWKLYPSKKGKGRVSDTKKLELLKIGFDEMSRAIERYKVELAKDSDWRKPQNGSTFFNSGYVDYLDQNYVPGEGRVKQEKNSFNQFSQRDYDFEELEKKLLEK
ncbi:MAG: hypothetical protein J1E83_12775 [Lachnospiraceae bacterium]|nr:hypothetical protein [Lachnospiraceae bacterium]